ncbi:MAG: Lrp/AsnC family transcriptional regulator [Actinomycetota bacterium]
MDALDWKIMAELQEDGRRPYREISRRLGISPGTVRLRALQLMEDGFLQVIAVPNSWRLGYLFQAVVGLKLDPGQADTVADILVERPEVGWVGLTTSRFDVLFEVMLEDGRQFGSYKEEFLGRLPGCRDIEVFEVWDVKKFNYELASIPEALGQLFASNATTLENDRTSRQQLGRTVGGRHLPPQPPAKAAP